jgi:phospholipid/cholesterol/gamma-HCH transport system permease protein
MGRGIKAITGTLSMALTTNTQDCSENEAKWQLGMALSRPFSFIGRATINWIDNLGASAVFLILALLKILRPKQLSKIFQQLYYIGARSMMIIMLVGLFTGMVLGLKGPLAPWSL